MSRTRTRHTRVTRFLFGSRESTFYPATRPSSQQRAIREIHTAQRNLSANPTAEMFLRLAKRFYLEGDFEQAVKRARDSIRYSMNHASRSLRTRSR